MQPSTVTLPNVQAIAPPSLFALLFVKVELMISTVVQEANTAPPIFDAVLFVNLQSMIFTSLTRSINIAPPPSELPFANVIFCNFMFPEFEMKNISVSPCPSSIVEFPIMVIPFIFSEIKIELFPVYVPGSR